MHMVLKKNCMGLFLASVLKIRFVTDFIVS